MRFGSEMTCFVRQVVRDGPQARRGIRSHDNRDHDAPTRLRSFQVRFANIITAIGGY